MRDKTYHDSVWLSQDDVKDHDTGRGRFKWRRDRFAQVLMASDLDSTKPLYFCIYISNLLHRMV